MRNTRWTTLAVVVVAAGLVALACHGPRETPVDDPAIRVETVRLHIEGMT